MKTKLIFSDFNKETGRSQATIASPIGSFTGYAKCHPEDEKSSFFGCQLAELRAELKAMKANKRLKVAQLDCLNSLYSSIKLSKDFKEQSLEARRIRKEIFIKRAEIADIDESIHSLTLYIKSAPQKRTETIKQINKDKTN